MKRLSALSEVPFILGLACAGVLLLPWLAWKWLVTPRLWREPRRRGTGGYWDHPS